MCGIAGTLEFNSRKPEENPLRMMVQAVEHRGPDGSHVDMAVPVGLGHARLRVIDLSEKADQPMWNEKRTVGIAFNGEIYNFREIRDELIRQGYQFKSHSDTEVILRLYEHVGAGAIPRLDGMFALAIWDKPRRRLVLARDRAGKKPLFYYQDNSRFIFGSEIKALLAHPDASRSPDLALLPFYVTYGYFPAPSTCYQRIRKLPPATILIVDAEGEREEKRYWSPPLRPNGITDEREAIARLRHLTQQAVRKRLISDVPLGAFLSGGIDSTVVVGLMSRELAHPVRTFSIGFEDAPDYDETGYAEMAARSFQTDHTPFRVQPPDGDFLEKLVYYHDGPFGDSSAIPTYVVSRLAREHVTVALNGDGGDELFAGYRRFNAAVMAERFPIWLRSFAARFAGLLPEPAHWSHSLRKAKRFLEVAGLPFEERYQKWCSYFPDASRDLLTVAEPDVTERVISEHFREHLRKAADATPLARLLYLNFCTYLPEDLLVKMDRSTMAHGLEARSPFLDTELVEFAAHLPDRLKLRGMTSKYILRQAFKDIIPEPILRRHKMGFGVPLGAWFRRSMRSYVEEHLASPNSRLFEFVRREAVNSILAEHMAGKRDFGHQLFCLLTLEIWLRTL